jgi:molybdopterin synthase sulfur carrier subunit
MRTVRVLYFAAVRDLVGKSEEVLDLPESVRAVEDLVSELVRLHPVLEGRLGGVRYALNETFAHPHDRIQPGDVIAVIPPVAGG